MKFMYIYIIKVIVLFFAVRRNYYSTTKQRREFELYVSAKAFRADLAKKHCYFTIPLTLVCLCFCISGAVRSLDLCMIRPYINVQLDLLLFAFVIMKI